jgi:hypothetical protein
MTEKNIDKMTMARLMWVWNINAQRARDAGILEVEGDHDTNHRVNVEVKRSGWFSKSLGLAAVQNLVNAMAAEGMSFEID